jgi:hypothetical protein
MAVKLRAEDFQRLVQIVSSLDSFRNIRDRIRLTAAAFEGTPRAADILSQIDFDGPARGVAGEIIRQLSQFGRIAGGKEALAIFLNEILMSKADEDQDAAFIRGLFKIYTLDKPIVHSPTIDTWLGTETDSTINEKIIGENTLRHVRILQLALETAKAVVHIDTAEGYGTGFMFAHDLLMTNNHVIKRSDVTMKSVFTFYYELDVDNKPRKVLCVSAKTNGLFYTNAALDYTVVQLDMAATIVQPLILKPMKVDRQQRVAIIQHPGGHFKKISMQNNFVEYADSQVVQYTTSTLPGSSGSPVFDDDFNVIAIHHSGGLLREPNMQQVYLRNE